MDLPHGVPKSPRSRHIQSFNPLRWGSSCIWCSPDMPLTPEILWSHRRARLLSFCLSFLLSSTVCTLQLALGSELHLTIQGLAHALPCPSPDKDWREVCRRSPCLPKSLPGGLPGIVWWPSSVGPLSPVSLTSFRPWIQSSPRLPESPSPTLAGDAGLKEACFCDAPLIPMYFMANHSSLLGQLSSLWALGQTLCQPLQKCQHQSCFEVGSKCSSCRQMAKTSQKDCLKHFRKQVAKLK